LSGIAGQIHSVTLQEIFLPIIGELFQAVFDQAVDAVFWKGAAPAAYSGGYSCQYLDTFISK